MKIQSMFRHFSRVALALALATGASIGFAQTADSEQISKLLSRAKSHAVMAENDAATLESYTRSKMDWQSHARQLERIKEHVNELGQLNKQLSDSRAEGSPWQQTAIDQVDMRLREMADLLTGTIRHLNDNPSQVHMQAYRDYVKSNGELTSRIAKMIDDFVDYDEAKSKAASLEQKLELPAVARNM
jgi:light-regulated signal transduction histidine kinase (bacteriophytochrome)